MENKKTNKFTFWDLVIFFTFYSVIGWCYEVFLEVVVYRWGVTNRGVLFGPYTPVYGFGALTFIVLWYRLIKDKPAMKKICMIPVIFLLTMVTATALELLTSYLCEWTMGSWPWQTYKDYAINFEGRIALSPSIRFGIGGVVFLYVIQPFLDKLAAKLSDKQAKTTAIIILAVLGIDMFCKFVLPIFFK